MIFGICSDKQIGSSVVVVITGCDTHVRLLDSIGAACDTGSQRVLFESTTTQIPIKIIETRIVGYKDIHPSVAVVVGYGHAHAFPDVR